MLQVFVKRGPAPLHVGVADFKPKVGPNLFTRSFECPVPNLRLEPECSLKRLDYGRRILGTASPLHKSYKLCNELLLRWTIGRLRLSCRKHQRNAHHQYRHQMYGYRPHVDLVTGDHGVAAISLGHFIPGGLHGPDE